MLDFLIQKDIELFLFLNSFNNSFWDIIMYYISAKYTWASLYLAVLVFSFVKYKVKGGLIVLLLFILLIVIADQSSVRFFKNIFERLRPCHNPEISEIIHNPFRCGGKFGFVSSHAANSFAFAVFSLLIFKKKWFSFAIIFWAIIVSYSRIYLGVHYPADILGGALLGTVCGLFVFGIFNKFNIKKLND